MLFKPPPLKLAVDISAYERDLSKYDAAIRRRALEAFKEDLGTGDITTQAVILDDKKADAVIVAQQDCVIAGVLEARAIFEQGGLRVSGRKDGDTALRGSEILKITGSVKEILARERTALNYLSRMSGMATVSRKLSKKHGKRVLFLRKVDPGLLFSEKRAVAVGGCLPHRINLSDGILIKDNHLKAVWALSGDRIIAVKEAIKRAARNRRGRVPIEIEVETLTEARAAAESFEEVTGIRLIMLDNMTPAQVKKAAKAVRDFDDSIIIEASGGVTEENISSYLKAGADFVSTSLFLKAKPVKFHLDVLM